MRANIADLCGKIRFVDDYDYKAMREDRYPPLQDTPTRKQLEGLFGILKGKNAFEADGVTLQRQWRDEWSE